MEAVKKLDTALSRWIMALPAGWQPVLVGASFFGEPWIILAVGASGFLAAAAAGQTQVQRAFFWTGAAYGINTLIKQLTRRRRPHNRKVSMLGIKSYSFPSGHAFGALAFYGIFGYLDYRYVNPPQNVLMLGALGILIVLVGVSRVRLGTHYPSDVIGGWILGGVTLALIIGLVF